MAVQLKDFAPLGKASTLSYLYVDLCILLDEKWTLYICGYTHHQAMLLMAFGVGISTLEMSSILKVVSRCEACFFISLRYKHIYAMSPEHNDIAIVLDKFSLLLGFIIHFPSCLQSNVLFYGFKHFQLVHGYS